MPKTSSGLNLLRPIYSAGGPDAIRTRDLCLWRIEKIGYPAIRPSTPRHDNTLKYNILLKMRLRRGTLKPPIVFYLVVSIW
jgi:hypothetical protein